MTSYRTCMTDRDHPVALLGSVIRGPGSTRARVYEHKLVLYETIGYGPHLCHWCREHIAWGSGTRQGVIVADHLDDDPLNNDPVNLVASCNRCNTLRARHDWRPRIEEREPQIINPDGTRTRAVEVTCEECGRPFLAHISRVRRETVKLCSRSCSGVRGARRRWGGGET